MQGIDSIKEGEKLRHLNSVSELIKLFLGGVLAMLNSLAIGRENRISPEFAEKIMLAVTGVNRCVYCSYLHSKTALEKGISEEEINRLLQEDVGELPEEEAIGVSYAQHWADTGGEVSESAGSRLVGYYGKKKARHIEAHIRAVYLGNMVCNTVYAFQNNMIDKKEKKKLYLTYILSLPLASMIKSFGKKMHEGGQQGGQR
jgi:AhpD family alkylhydroperoxidase